MTNIISLIIGILIGGFLVRYGLGLGVRLTYQIKEDIMPLDKTGQGNIEQDSTREITEENKEIE